MTAVLALAAVSLAGVTRAQTTTPPAETQPAATTRPAGQPDVSGYVDQLSRTLQEGSPSARYEAAQRLVTVAGALDRVGSAAARMAIGTALSGDERAQKAAARAVSEAASPDRAWVPPLVRMLSARDRDTADSAARALSRLDEDPIAYRSLIEAARVRQPGQLAAIRALGRVVQKPVGEALVGLVGDASQPADVREAAAESLSRLGGQPAGADEPAVWARWWNARMALDDAAWRTQVIAEGHRGLETDDQRAAQRLAELRKSLGDYLLHQYEVQTSASRKMDLLLEYLNDPDPDFRAAGAAIVPEAVNAALSLRPEVKSRLVYLLGDASPEVRLKVAGALETLVTSDAGAMDALVLQLRFEPDLRVKKALIQTLAHTDPRGAVPVLTGLLQDPSEAVAGAAADGLRMVAQAPNNANNPALAPVFGELLNVLRARTGPPGQPRPGPAAADLRARLVGAMAAMSNRNPPGDMVDLFSGFVQPEHEPSAVRQAAMQGLGAAGDLAGPTISNQLNDKFESDPNVRRAAATALGMIPSFLWASRLDESTKPQVEQDPAVREAAWRAFQRVAQFGAFRDLVGYADGFRRRGDHVHEVLVRRAACRALENQPGQAQSLAMQRWTVGDVYMDDLKLPLEAIPFYRDAVAYFDAQNSRQPKLVRSLERAYLSSRQYDQAIQFARQQMQRFRGNVEDLFPEIANTAETMKDSKDPAVWDQARELVAMASTLDLDQLQRDRLKSIRDEIKPPPATQPVR